MDEKLDRLIEQNKLIIELLGSIYLTTITIAKSDAILDINMGELKELAERIKEECNKWKY